MCETLALSGHSSLSPETRKWNTGINGYTFITIVHKGIKTE